MKRGPKLAAGETADVTLLLEGTYPYVSGGVSSWVHQIIRGLPDIRFSLVFIGGSPEKTGKMRYELPPNVVHLEEHYLSDVPKEQRVVSRRGDEAFHRDIKRLHDVLAGAPGAPGTRAPSPDDSASNDAMGPSSQRHAQRRVSGFVSAGSNFESLARAATEAIHGDRYVQSATLADALNPVVAAVSKNPHGHERDFLFSELSWEMICERYQSSARERSFLEYFWCVRSMHTPLFVMARAAESIPPSRAFHVISTGFAGFLGMLLSRARKVPLILTEHGIYTKERRIELLQASWIKDDELPTEAPGSIGHFRQMWIRFFEALGKMTYAAADPIISLYEGNRARQITDGAEPARTRVLANGIDIARFAPLRERRAPGVPKVLGLIGRVVPIKDIKTFIRTMRVVSSELPGTEGWIVGPEEEDPNYAAECHDLVKGLGLTNVVKFLGFQKVEDVLPKLGLNVLTSISEAQPLVVLEAFAAGVPCVSSDVGCCRELIEGTTEPDRALGAAGRVVKIADPEATGKAAVELLRDEQAWYAAQQAGIARVERLYTQAQMLERYRAVYEEALAPAARTSQRPSRRGAAE